MLRKILVVVLLVSVLGLGIILRGQGAQADSYHDEYSYPITPGSADWAKLQNHEEMVAISQIPQDTLAQMSTPFLLDKVLTYPLYGDMLAYDTLQQGFDAVASNFDGLQELMQREDIGTILLAVYEEMDPQAIETQWSLEETGFFERRFTYVEVLLAQPQIMQKLSPEQQTQLLRQLSKTAESKIHRFDVYGVYGVQNTVWVVARTLAARQELAGIDSSAVQSFIETGSTEDSETINLVLERLAQVLAQEKPLRLPISTPEGSNKDSNTTVRTPRNTAVSVIKRTTELTSQQIAANDAWVRNTYPSATLLRNSTRKYNCHSYAWHSTSSSNIYWMNSPGDDKYWEDGSYSRLNFCPASNARISYPNGDHSAHLDGNGRLTSKWGPLGVVKHTVSYCPYNASDVRYYR